MLLCYRLLARRAEERDLLAHPMQCGIELLEHY